MPRFLCLLIIALSFLTLSPPAQCQNADFVPILAGDKHPLTLKLKDLDSTWRQMSANIISTSNAVPSLVISQGMAVSRASSEIDPYYTQGKTVVVAGEIFLVAYHRIYTPGETVSLINGRPPTLLSPPTTTLALCLINLRQIASLDGIQAYVPQTAAETAQIKQQADDDASVSNLKQLGLAIDQYMQDNDERLPPMAGALVTKTAIYPFVKNDATFEQPQTHALYQPNTSLSHRSLVSFAEITTIVIYYEPDPAPDGKRAVLFLDGHVRRVEDSEWQRLKAASHIPNPRPASLKKVQ